MDMRKFWSVALPFSKVAYAVKVFKYERVFSSVKHLVTNLCNYLKANIIKANKCLKS